MFIYVDFLLAEAPVEARHLCLEGGGVEGFADGGVNGVDQEGAKGAYKIVGAGGVTVTTSTAEDLEHGGVKYFVSGKSVTVTLSAGTSYSAVDGASNPVALTDNGGGSYTLTMPAADVTILAD